MTIGTARTFAALVSAFFCSSLFVMSAASLPLPF
jgi:hypothetical protein